MGRSEPNPFQSVESVQRIEQLNKWAFPVCGGKDMPPVKIDNLSKQGHFLYSFCDERPDLSDNFWDWPAPLVSTRVGDNAKCAMHIAPLHNGYERGDLFFVENVVPDRALRVRFLFHVDDRKPDIVAARRPFAFDGLVDVIGNAMKFLGSDDKVQVRDFVQKR